MVHFYHFEILFEKEYANLGQIRGWGQVKMFFSTLQLLRRGNTSHHHNPKSID